MKRSFIALLSLVFVNLKSFAYDELGNGGNMIYCKNTLYPEMLRQNYMLQDYLEITQQGYKIEFPDFSFREDSNKIEDAIFIAQKMLDRIKELDPHRHMVYSKELQNFSQNLLLDFNLIFPWLPDHGVVKAPGADCEIIQTAYQREPILPFHKRYNIKAEVWSLLKVQVKAGLILHEVIYKEAHERGHTVSDRTRQFNGLLATNHFENMNIYQYKRFLVDVMKFSYVPTM